MKTTWPCKAWGRVFFDQDEMTVCYGHFLIGREVSDLFQKAAKGARKKKLKPWTGAWYAHLKSEIGDEIWTQFEYWRME